MRTFLILWLLFSSLTISLLGQNDFPYAVDYLDFNKEGRALNEVERVMPGPDVDVVVMTDFPEGRERFFRFDGERLTSFFLAALDEFEYTIQTRLGNFIIINDRTSPTRSAATQLDIRNGETRVLFTATGGWRAGAVAGAGYVYFDRSRRVWGTDGTEAGTFLITEQVLDFEVYTWNGNAIIATDQGVFRSDGTEAGTSLLHSSPVEGVADTATWNGQLYLSLGNALFVTDGTAAGSEYLITQAAGQFLSDLTATVEGVVFSAISPDTGREPWTTDGTVAGTQIIVDLFTGARDGIRAAGGTSSTGSRLFFRGSPDGSDDRVYEVFPSGIVERLQISNPELDNWRFRLLAETGDGHMFMTTPHLIDREVLWRLHPSGDVVAMDTFSRFALNQGSTYSTEHAMFFQSADAPQHLGYANTSELGTRLIDSVGAFNETWRGVLADTLYYTIRNNDPDSPIAIILRQVDGQTGTIEEFNISTTQRDGASPFILRAGTMYYIGLDSFSSEGLFRLEAAAAILLQDIFPYTRDAQFDVIGQADEYVYLRYNSDAYVVGPDSSEPLRLGVYPGSSSDPIAIGHNLLIRLDDDQSLFLSPTGLSFIDFPPEYRARRGGYTLYDEDLFFLVNGSSSRQTSYYLIRLDLADLTTFTEVFSYESEEALRDWNLITQQIAVANDLLFFPFPSPATGWELGQSDGTTAGTVLFEDIIPGTASSAPNRIYGQGLRIAVQTANAVGANNLYLRRLDNGQRFWANTEYTADRLDGLTSLPGYSLLRLRLSTSSNDGLLIIDEQARAIRPLEFQLNSSLWPLSDGRMGWWQDHEEFFITAGPVSSDELIENITDANSNASTVRDDFLMFVRSDFGRRSLHALELNDRIYFDFPAITPEFDTDFYPTSTRVFFPATSKVPGYELHFFGRTDLRECSGTVFNDSNGNGIQDENEEGLSGQVVVASGTEQTFARSDEEGLFQLRLISDQEYTLSVRENGCFFDSRPTSYFIDSDVACPDPLTFGLRLQEGEPNYTLNLTLATNRCGFVVPAWLLVENGGCTELQSEIKLELPDGVSLVNSAIPPSLITDNLLVWDGVLLQAGERLTIDLELQMPDESQVGQSLEYRLSASGIYEFDLLHEEDFLLTRTLRCAIDPNDKLVAPSRAEPSNSNYTQVDETLLYTIRFQNTGNDTAINVRLEDQLDPLLDWGSFTPLHASHPYWTKLDDAGQLTVFFDNILLPDSTTNEPESHGFFAFTINLLPEALDQSVSNTAGIYFDFNAPIITNTVESSVVEFLDQDQDGYFFWEDCLDDNVNVNPGMEEIPGNGLDDDCLDGDAPVSTQERLLGTLRVLPNPTNGLLILSYPESTRLQVTLFDGHGQLIGEYSLQRRTQINLDDWPAGVYWLRVIEPETGRFASRRIVKY